jgi:carbonic anhydrase
MWRPFLTFTALLAGGAGAVPALAQGRSPGPPHWSYSGPDGADHWGDLDPSFAACKTGRRQAPIDIKGATVAVAPDLEPILFDYKPAPMVIIDNGHTIRVNHPAGSITVDGKQYPFTQFHFHHPSEEELNGQRSEMALHLMHINPDGTGVGIAIMIKSGRENPLIREIWSRFPTEIDKEVEYRSVILNAADLLPADRNYYVFDGSITAPPCTEGVRWFVMKAPIELSPAQIAAFAKVYPDNVRPVQPPNGRPVVESSFSR